MINLLSLTEYSTSMKLVNQWQLQKMQDFLPGQLFPSHFVSKTTTMSEKKHLRNIQNGADDTM